MAVDFKVEIRDRAFNLLEVLDREIGSISWDYTRIGGCGGFSFSLPRDYCDEKYISGDFNIRIYLRNEDTKNYDLWYQGLVEQKVPSVQNGKESINVVGHGYVAQLTTVQISQTYTSQELKAVVKAILDNYVIGVKDITYDTGDLVSTGFTADSLKFNCDTQSAIKTCADIAGSREWGVDKDRKFFFKERSSVPGFWFVLGKNITRFQEDQSFKEIVNRVIVQGGDISGTPYTATYNDAQSQLKYGRRDRVFQNSAIKTAAVSSQFADSIFADYSEVVRKATCQVAGLVQRIEGTVPIPLFVLKSAPAVRYGQEKYGTFLYSGTIARQIHKISYSINTTRDLTIDLDLGFFRPSQAEMIKRLEYNLEQLRSSNL